MHLDHPIIEARRNGFLLSTDPAILDVEAIHGYLTRSYWSPGISRSVVERAIAGSVCFGVYSDAGQQVGFARVVTDATTFAYLCDVYVLEEHQRRGLGRWLVEAVIAHPSLQGLRRFVLVTRDAHDLYKQYGFRPLGRPDGYMEIHRPNVYAQPGTPD